MELDHPLIALAIGVLVGAALAWWRLEKRAKRRVDAVEKRWRVKAEHLRREVESADAAHAETKRMLLAAHAEEARALAEADWTAAANEAEAGDGVLYLRASDALDGEASERPTEEAPAKAVEPAESDDGARDQPRNAARLESPDSPASPRNPAEPEPAASPETPDGPKTEESAQPLEDEAGREASRSDHRSERIAAPARDGAPAGAPFGGPIGFGDEYPPMRESQASQPPEHSIVTALFDPPRMAAPAPSSGPIGSGRGEPSASRGEFDAPPRGEPESGASTRDQSELGAPNAERAEREPYHARRESDAPASFAEGTVGAPETTSFGPFAGEIRAAALVERAQRLSIRGPVAAERDDLKRIKGVGPATERQLRELGVERFAQIAAWSADDIARVDEVLAFKGRILRDDWVGQARTLERARRGGWLSDADEAEGETSS